MLPKTIQDRFFKDPEWHIVEETILSFITPLLDMTTVDTTQPAEQVKAEIIGRRLAYESLEKFVRSSGIVRKDAPVLLDKNIFR